MLVVLLDDDETGTDCSGSCGCPWLVLLLVVAVAVVLGPDDILGGTSTTEKASQRDLFCSNNMPTMINNIGISGTHVTIFLGLGNVMIDIPTTKMNRRTKYNKSKINK